jgi:hypothetical protein
MSIPIGGYTAMTQQLEESLARLEQYRSTGRLIRHTWTGELADGRDTACLLAALSEEAGRAKSVEACPAELLDPWFANLTQWFDDAGSDAAWPGMVARYGAVVRKLMSLPLERRMKIEYASRAIIVREVMRHTMDAEVLSVCEIVASLSESVADGSPRDEAAFAKARHVAEKAEAQAAQHHPQRSVRRLWCLYIMGRLRLALAASSAHAADSSEAAAYASEVEAWAWSAASAVAAAMGSDEETAVADRITSQIFDLIEAAQ